MVQKYKNYVTNKPQLFGNVSKEEYQKLIANKKVQINKYGKIKTVKQSRHYKWILSPEKNLDDNVLQEYTKCFISRLEQNTGYKFVWQAAIHRDTDHPHVHLLINGIDMDGKEVKGFSKDIIQNYAREFSQEILTHFCGERDAELIRQAKERRITAVRWTEYDKTIHNMIKADNTYSDYEGYINTDIYDGEVKQRLIFLESLELVERKNDKYYVKKDFENELRTYGRYNVFRDAKQYVNGELKLYTKDIGEIKGTIKKIYTMNDEDVWTNGAVIENEKTGESYFIPSFNPISKKVGDNIKIVRHKTETGKDITKFKNINIIKRTDGSWDYTD